MNSLWDSEEAKSYSQSELQMRVYTSRLLGRNDQLVLHGGGNTSVKLTKTNLFNEQQQTLYVKGSGWDLKTIETAGFVPTDLNYLKKLVTLNSLSDSEMVNELKKSQLDPTAPAPSVEAILHAIIPFKFVDHTHADAIVAISNTQSGQEKLNQIFGDRVLILPYVMPGFILAKQVYKATLDIDWQKLDGIILLHHGVFTFHEDAKQSYELMIKLVTQAEGMLAKCKAYNGEQQGSYEATDQDYLQIVEMRKTVSTLVGRPMLSKWKLDNRSTGFSMRNDVFSIVTCGPLTPDHTLYTKRIPATIDTDPLKDIQEFSEQYKQYFEENKSQSLTQLDSAPRYAVWKGRGCIVFGSDHKKLRVISDIVDHTIKAIQWGEEMGGWQALPVKDIFDLEYWELEQAKLKKNNFKLLFEGKVVLVSGAASGIGKACVQQFMDQGACVTGLDINPAIAELFKSENYLGQVCNVTDQSEIVKAIKNNIRAFGGIDIVVSNAGSFPPSKDICQLDEQVLQHSLDLNFKSHVSLVRECTPYLKLGIDPVIIFIASKNVPAPGPGAAAYSTAKAALTQFARVAALELGQYGIRINTLHPNAVFDTGVWTDEILEQRASHYNLKVDEYRKNNILQTEVTSMDVAKLVSTMAGPSFAKTTGAQLPIDGGNERVI